MQPKKLAHEDLEIRAQRRGGRWGRRGLREAEHERGAALLGDEGSELAPGLVHSLAVLGAHGRVVLRHGCDLRPERALDRRMRRDAAEGGSQDLLGANGRHAPRQVYIATTERAEGIDGQPGRAKRAGPKHGTARSAWARHGTASVGPVPARPDR
jgi:hypothetical protein